MISINAARTIAVSASGVHQNLALREAVERMLCVQLDSINYVARAHALTLSVRTGLPIETVPEALWTPGNIFEYPLHASCVVSVRDWPLVAPLMRAALAAPPKWAPRQDLADKIMELLATRGPLSLPQMDLDEDVSRGWNWSAGRSALEYLVLTGQVVCVERSGWTRVYDLPHRVIPPDLLRQELPREEALRGLVRRAVHAMGVASAQDVAEYLRMSIQRAENLLTGLEGLEATRIEGLEHQYFTPPEAPTPADPDDDRATVLNPFDNLVWDRRRTQILFGFTHTLEAYKPASRRQFGYYTCPVLVGTDLIGRVALKADRKNRRLIVEGSWLETGPRSGRAALNRAVADLEQRMFQRAGRA